MLVPVSLWGLVPYLNPRFPAFHSIRRNCNGRSVTATCGCTSEPKFWKYMEWRLWHLIRKLSGLWIYDTIVVHATRYVSNSPHSSFGWFIDENGHSWEIPVCMFFVWLYMRPKYYWTQLLVRSDGLNYAESWCLHPNKGYYHLHRRDGSSCRLGSDLQRQ